MSLQRRLRPSATTLALLGCVCTALLLVLAPTVRPNVASDGITQAELALATIAPPSSVVERVDPQPRGRPVVPVVATPAPLQTPQETPGATLPEPPPPVQRAPSSTPVPAPPACPTSFFCYPRLGITGAIVAYDDCSGKTDVGSTIRQLTCIGGGIWLAGHAYTQFGGIAGFLLGDVVFVRGQRFEITGSIVQRACAPTTAAIAPLSLQTSLDPTPCGRVLVVQGR